MHATQSAILHSDPRRDSLLNIPPPAMGMRSLTCRTYMIRQRGIISQRFKQFIRWIQYVNSLIRIIGFAGNYAKIFDFSLSLFLFSIYSQKHYKISKVNCKGQLLIVTIIERIKTTNIYLNDFFFSNFSQDIKWLQHKLR